jgi:putative peptidoglycan lipid II flippase
LRYAVVRVLLTTSLGYFFALVLPGLLGVDARLGAAGLTASAGLAGWVEFYFLRRALDGRIGRTRLVGSRMARLWFAAIVAAMLPWLYKIIVDRDSPLLSIHSTVVESKSMAFLLLAVYGLTYLAITAAFRIPEASNVVDRGLRMLRLGRARK